MAERPPQKAGASERPATRPASTAAITMGLTAVLAVMVVAVCFLR